MTEEQLIKDAQFRKGLSIAFFNATNNASQIIELIYKEHPQNNEEVVKSDIVKWRDWLLSEHRKYYAEVIANVGKHYNAEESIKKLKSVKNLEEVKSVWVGFSEDERQDAEILKIKNEIKKSYESKK